jgi:hypothetical protein
VWGENRPILLAPKIVVGLHEKWRISPSAEFKDQSKNKWLCRIVIKILAACPLLDQESPCCINEEQAEVLILISAGLRWSRS